MKTLLESLRAGDEATPKKWNDQELNEVVGRLAESGNLNGRSFYEITGQWISISQLMSLADAWQQNKNNENTN